MITPACHLPRPVMPPLVPCPARARTRISPYPGYLTSCLPLVNPCDGGSPVRTDIHIGTESYLVFSKLPLRYQVRTKIFCQHQQTTHRTLFTALALLRSTALDHPSAQVPRHSSPLSFLSRMAIGPYSPTSFSVIGGRHICVLLFMRSGCQPSFNKVNDLPHLTSSTFYSAVSLGLWRRINAAS